MITGFIESFRRSPGHYALEIEDQAYTYAELMEIAAGISARIMATGRNDKNIGIHTNDSVFTYASILAVLLCGKTFIPLNRKFPAHKLENIIRESGLKIVLCASSEIEGLSSGLSAGNDVSLISNDNCDKVDFSALSFTLPDSDNFAYILFTSGSTGIPKGIGITHSNFNAFIKAMFSPGKYDLGPTDKFLQMFELSFDVSIACTFMAWECGGCLVPVPTSDIVFISALETMRDKQVTFVSMAPSAVAYMKQLRLLEEFSFPSIRYTLLTGEALPYKLAQAWKETAPNSVIENAYGPTEVTVWSSIYRLNDETEKEILNGLVPIGHVLDGLEYQIVDEKLAPVKQGASGELLLYGAQVANGYWNNPEKTEQSFVRMDGREGKWYRTGDSVIVNANGNIVYINRIDNQVQINGFRVELGEIEFRIREFTNANGAVVIACEHPFAGTLTLVAFIESKEGSFAELRAHLEATLPSYMVPKHYYALQNMPLNNSGKIDRRKLKEMHHE
ncbi:MAG TPA: amino acid adenylation domain-containing protein [Bacteroidia bacterium]|jgi:amino acid adenylation domain-containing protein|nr:amino acid adenylation domain-containing protein [Bacteroidia bacterium]